MDRHTHRQRQPHPAPEPQRGSHGLAHFRKKTKEEIARHHRRYAVSKRRPSMTLSTFDLQLSELIRPDGPVRSMSSI